MWEILKAILVYKLIKLLLLAKSATRAFLGPNLSIGSHILEVTYKVYSYHFDPIAMQSSIVEVMAEVALGLAHIKAYFHNIF